MSEYIYILYTLFLQTLKHSRNIMADYFPFRWYDILRWKHVPHWLLILYLYFPVLYLHECISCGMDISHKIRAAVCDQFLDSCRTITFPGLSYLSSVSWSWPVIGQTPGNAGVSASPQPWPQAWWWRQSCQLITSHPWDMGEHSVLCHKARSENSWRMLLLCQLTAETDW